MLRKIAPGLTFSILWASGAVAVKFGIRSADALMLASIRFILTGIIFCPYFLYIKKERFWPYKSEWKSIFIYGILCTTLTLGTFFAAQAYSSAGISMLFIAVAPLLIALLSSIVLKRKLTRYEIAGMVIAFSGLVLTSAAALPNASIKPLGILLLLIYITAYALSSVYFSTIKLQMKNSVFNVWQVFIGGIVLLPFCPLFGQAHISRFDANLVLVLLWLIFILSFIANQLWLYLIGVDPVAAGTWLYLTPVFGYAYGYFILGEPITIWSILGAILVVIGLVFSKRKEVV
ncbi:EamA family transporter [Mucilaginibacter pallidiroseus]|uniref:EamA family transporter n=1 Tax=Mucilaginibacter pallidiroseus TaxID=2599295 RepID=A0A563UCW2_9SPHI|nr:EamA family transporter [Mucilaginibacter pallidiroseus]TWR29198.1 EamA family transporter [Mucilaginibacter pallidiroseus]